MNYYSLLPRHKYRGFPDTNTIILCATSSKLDPRFVPTLTSFQSIRGSLCLDGTPLHALPRVLFPLLLEELALLIGAETTQFGVSHLLLRLVKRKLPLFGLLLIICLLDLGDLLVAGLLDAAEGFGAEVSVRSKLVGEAEEVLEDRHGGGVVRGEFQGEAEALLGLGLVEAGIC